MARVLRRTLYKLRTMLMMAMAIVDRGSASAESIRSCVLPLLGCGQLYERNDKVHDGKATKGKLLFKFPLTS